MGIYGNYYFHDSNRVCDHRFQKVLNGLVLLLIDAYFFQGYYLCLDYGLGLNFYCNRDLFQIHLEEYYPSIEI